MERPFISLIREDAIWWCGLSGFHIFCLAGVGRRNNWKETSLLRWLLFWGSMKCRWNRWWTVCFLDRAVPKPSCEATRQYAFYGVSVEVRMSHYGLAEFPQYPEEVVGPMWLDHDKWLILLTPRNLRVSAIATSPPLMVIGACTPLCFLKSITKSFLFLTARARLSCHRVTRFSISFLYAISSLIWPTTVVSSAHL